MTFYHVNFYQKSMLYIPLYTPISITKIQNTNITKCYKNAEQQELSFTAGGNAEWYSHFG